jgi:hypothetical protein
MASRISTLLLLGALLVTAAEPTLKLKSFPDVLDLKWEFDPVKAAYWTGLPHHRRTPFGVSPDGQTGYLAYLDASGKGVHVQHIHPPTMSMYLSYSYYKGCC